MEEYDEVVIDSGNSLLVDTLERRWRTYFDELKRCRKEPSEVVIHDLRVATRRLLALIDMLREFSPHPRLQKLRRAFKKQLDGLDDLRDTQVMLVEVAKTLNDLPDLVPFQVYLNKKEKRLLRSTTKAIKSFNPGNVKKRVYSTRKALFKIENEIDQRESLLHIVDGIFDLVMQRYQQIEPTNVATIHHVRVAFKKFRYSVEIIHPLIPNFPESNYKIMHDYQSMMGEIQDVEVFNSVFDEFVKKDASHNPNHIRQYYSQRHKEKVNAFLEKMYQIDTFWRSETKAPFPWETGKRR